MKAIIREDDQAVSPVIATILMVAITVVLAAVLYVMVSGLITTPTTPSSGWGINLGKSGDGSNWTVSFTTVPSGATQSSVFVTVNSAGGTPLASNIALSAIAAGTGHKLSNMYFNPLSGTAVSAGDTLLLLVSAYPSGSTIQIVSGTSVVYTHTLS